MGNLKLTTWNIEHFSRMFPADTPTKQKKLTAIAAQIREMSPDILCIIEGPGNLVALKDWVAAPNGLNGEYQVPIVDGTEAILATNPPNVRSALSALYGMQGNDTTGNQWIWFLVRDGLYQHSGASMQNPVIWHALTQQKRWRINEWNATKPKWHSHYRQPQILTLQIGGIPIEIIGLHLKSKINREDPFDGDSTELSPIYVQEALQARVALTTEAFNVRRYIDARFAAEPEPRIIVCGDLNDGPGREHFEREYLFMDLLTNIQGDVFFARKFLNHALFDYQEELRWSTRFRDKIEEWSRTLPEAVVIPEPYDSARFQLIDHILFTQPFADETALPRIEKESGFVEHTATTKVSALHGVETSDHRPVSVMIRVLPP